MVNYKSLLEDTSGKLDESLNESLTLYQVGRNREAFELFNNAIAKLWTKIGVILTNSNNYEDAFEAFNKALEIDPRNHEAEFYVKLLYSMRPKHDENSLKS